MTLEEVKKTTEITFEENFTEDEKLILIGEEKGITHAHYIVLDEIDEIAYEFNVSANNVYGATLRKASNSWWLRHVLDFTHTLNVRLKAQ